MDSRVLIGKTDFGKKTRNWFIWAPNAQTSIFGATAMSKCRQAIDAAPHIYHITRASLDPSSNITGEAWVCSGGEIPGGVILSERMDGWHDVYEIKCTLGLPSEDGLLTLRDPVYVVNVFNILYMYTKQQGMYLPLVPSNDNIFTDFGVQTRIRKAGPLGGGDIVVKMLANCGDHLRNAAAIGDTWTQLFKNSIFTGQPYPGSRTVALGTLSDGKFGCCMIMAGMQQCIFDTDLTSGMCTYTPCGTILQKAEDMNTSFYWDILVSLATRAFDLVVNGFELLVGKTLDTLVNVPGFLPTAAIGILVHSRTDSLILTALLTVAIVRALILMGIL